MVECARLQNLRIPLKQIILDIKCAAVCARPLDIIKGADGVAVRKNRAADISMAAVQADAASENIAGIIFPIDGVGADVDIGVGETIKEDAITVKYHTGG
ncbi:MAG: hypothetical protein BWY12_02702 [candidate division BRC1 bacterium ADurb.Bin183]|nr:MAG: hypothetical protein BWY12_02702 [candidate division BRC1 bacterium ADurb.Bin183]